MKKLSILIAVLAIFTLLGLASCGGGQAKLKDGVYFAQDTAFDDHGWRPQVILTVKGGKITQAEWNGVPNIAGAQDKKAYSRSGAYGMEKIAKQGSWDTQAVATEAYLVKTQNLKPSFNAEGKTDVISGASMTVDVFFTLANAALKNAPVAKGSYKDGWFYAESDNFDPETTWKDTVLVTVVNGTIVDVLWNGISSDTSLASKIIESTEGRYGMEKIAKQGSWHDQAKRVEDAIVKSGNPASIPVKADGSTDAISGATIHVTAVPLAIKALAAAK